MHGTGRYEAPELDFRGGARSARVVSILDPFCLCDACLYRRRISTARFPLLTPATLFIPLGLSQLLVFVLCNGSIDGNCFL